MPVERADRQRGDQRSRQTVTTSSVHGTQQKREQRQMSPTVVTSYSSGAGGTTCSDYKAAVILSLLLKHCILLRRFCAAVPVRVFSQSSAI